MESLEKFVNRMTDKHDQIAKEVDEHADRPSVMALWEPKRARLLHEKLGNAIRSALAEEWPHGQTYRNVSGTKGLHRRAQTLLCPSPHCLRRFARLGELNRHKDDAHVYHGPAPPGHVQCPIADCFRSFRTDGILKRHRPAVMALWEGAKTIKVNPRSCTGNLEMQLGTTVLANP